MEVHLKILLIDDQPESVEALHEQLVKDFGEIECRVVDFPAAVAAIEQMDPDLVVLDLLHGSDAELEAPGLETANHIWTRKFCPLIFYTAAPERVSGSHFPSHPFVGVVPKGIDSELRVRDKVKSFHPHVEALAQVRKEIRSAMDKALQSVAPRVMEAATASVPERIDMLTRAARRFVAAQMDEALTNAKPPPLKNWEFYLCPPLVAHLLTGDIVRQKSTDKTQPSNYAIVLTPSCDLVCEGTRVPKVAHVLVAICTPVERLLQDLNVPSKDAHEHRNEIRSMLSRGYTQSCLAIAALPGEFPAMAADFRQLRLIALDDDKTGLKNYDRVASVDNPLRELFAWAFMLSSARPALPDRNYKDWAKEIVEAVKA
jgi:CheY-like chemotaxis protein